MGSPLLDELESPGSVVEERSMLVLEAAELVSLAVLSLDDEPLASAADASSPQAAHAIHDPKTHRPHRTDEG